MKGRIKFALLSLINAAVAVVCSACAGPKPLPETEGTLYNLEKYDYYEHWVQSDDGKNIYGRLCVPLEFDETAEYTTVIMSHGFTATHKVWNNYIEAFTARGFVCYAFDFCGGAQNNNSDGSFYDMSVMTEMSDLKHVIDDIINKQKYVNCGNVYLMGESMGGLVTALVAPEVKDDISGVGLMYPAFNIPDDVRKNYPDKTNIPDRPGMLWTKVGKRYVEDIYELNAYDSAAEYRGDVVIYHGDKDDLVDIKYSQKAVDMYGGNAELNTLKGSSHGFSAKVAKTVSNALADRWRK